MKSEALALIAVKILFCLYVNALDCARADRQKRLLHITSIVVGVQ